LAFSNLLTNRLLYVSGILLVLLSIPVLTFVVELVTAAVRRPRLGQSVNWSKSLTMTVLIPAHNEATCIAATLQSILPPVRASDRVVVADNCIDNTADLARSQGAIVLERHNDRQRGKGYALDYGLQHLAESPPDIVIVIDADCDVKPGSLAALTRYAHQNHCPAQATHIMAAQPEESLRDSISRFAVKVKNLVRPLGLKAWGQPCLLNGTGMAFPWTTLQQIDLATASIVEDMKMGLDLAIAGTPPQLCPEAVVTSRLPTNDAVSTQQRTRWKHGHLQIISTYTLPLFTVGGRRARLDLIALGSEITILPLTLLVLLYTSMLVLAFGIGLPTYVWGLFVIAFSLEIMLVIALVLAWAMYGREELSVKQPLQLSVYMLLWKLPILAKIFTKRESGWVRTER